jgi:hypothetical protein
MGYKKMDQNLGFALMKSASLLLDMPQLNRRKSGVERGKNFMGQAELALASSLKHNRSLKIHPVKYVFQTSA